MTPPLASLDLLGDLVALPRAVQIGFTAVLGLLIGSFLNVCIHRLPKEGMSVRSARRSHCPKCDHELRWFENLPVLSWCLQRGRCRACSWPIPVRYPLVELLTGVLFGVVAWRTPWDHPGLLFFQLLVIAGLVVATFVDFDCFEIPDEVSIGGMVLAPLISLALPELHADTILAQEMSSTPGIVDRGGALMGCLAGMATGGGILLGIGWLGKKLFGRDAMGLGDVKLLAAAGGFVGPGAVLMALFLGSMLASVVGALNIARFFCLLRRRTRERGTRKSALQALQTARIVGRYLPFGPYLSLGVGIVLVDWKDVLQLFESFTP